MVSTWHGHVGRRQHPGDRVRAQRARLDAAEHGRPVALAAMIVIRLRTVVSQQIAPQEIAVLTVGTLHAGTRVNVIAGHAVLEINLRSYDQAARQHLLDAIQRIVRAECQASGVHGPQAYRAAVQASRVEEDIPANHSAKFLPVLQPTLRTGTEALVVAAGPG
jgi:metal-dependent amidase/aminoacylase/carboxypeptidase family protein